MKEAKRLAEDALLSSKGHFVSAQFWSSFHLWIGIPVAMLSAVAAAFTFSDSFRIAVGVLALIIAMLSAIGTFLNPNEKAATHRNAANNYDALRTRCRMFWTIECWKDGMTDQVLTEKLRDLCDDKNKLNQSYLQIPKWAYARAKRAVRAGEGVYQIDKQQ